MKAKPKSKEDKVEKVDEHTFVVHVKALPVDGKANAAITALLARYFDVSPSLVNIISGHWSKTKIIEVIN